MILSGNQIRSQLGKDIVVEPFDDTKLLESGWRYMDGEEAELYDEEIDENNTLSK